MTSKLRLCVLVVLAVLGLGACAGAGQPADRPDRPEPSYRITR